MASPALQKNWRVLSTRTLDMQSHFALSAEEIAPYIRRCSKQLWALSEVDYKRFLNVIDWLKANYAEGLMQRQLPIRGVDTKWIEKHNLLIASFFEATTNQILELKKPHALVRIKILDAKFRDSLFGVAEMSVTLDGLEKLGEVFCGDKVGGVSGESSGGELTVFLFENLESVVAMPDMPNAIVIFGSGYTVGQLSEVRWLHNAHIVYWGDLDSHGFAILNRVRSHFSSVSVVMMDIKTLLNYKDLWVKDPKPSTATLTNLKPEEAETLEFLRSNGNIRLEQERIEWDKALEVLRGCAARA
jgi:hypothetical protein